MRILEAMAYIFKMNEVTWKRHTNPWSVWTRILAFPFLILAIYSRAWIGEMAWFFTAIVAIFLWLNPRLFPIPNSTNNWASKGVIGERILLDYRKGKQDLPRHHVTAAYIAATYAAVGFLVLVYGLMELSPWPTVMGGLVAHLGKIWFIDRMAWLCEDMKKCTPNDEIFKT